MSAEKRTGHDAVIKARHAAKAGGIEAYHLNYRQAVHELVSQARPLADLANSFPALLFALASGYGNAHNRKQVIAMVLAGKPLKQCAAKLGLPWWTRKLPSSAFTRPFGQLPSGQRYDTRLSQLVPQREDYAGPWLDRVSYACEACHEQFSLWVARQYGYRTPDINNERFLLLTAWAWYSGQEQTTGRKIMRRPWTAAMGQRRAMEEMSVWQKRIAMVGYLGKAAVSDVWAQEGSALGYDFVALRTIEDFIAESQVMDNCLDQYADHLTDRVVRLFSIRKNGKPVADVEIGSHSCEHRMPALLQLRGPRNRRAPAKVWQAAYTWLGQNEFKPLPFDRTRMGGTTGVLMRREKVWQPYLDMLAARGNGHDVRLKKLVLKYDRYERKVKKAGRAEHRSVT